MRYLTALICVGALALVSCVEAGGGKKTIKIGDPCPNFTDLPGVDGKKHSLSEYKQDVLVIAITCNHCPVAVAYEDRIINFVKKNVNDKVGLVAINVNNLEADKLEKMVIRAKDKGFNFPYLYDSSQKVARALSARVTPEFYVFNKERKLVYWGSLDDSQNPNKAKTNYLEAAVTATAAGKTPATATTKAFGCSVKYED
jgi:peroxiredoxin